MICGGRLSSGSVEGMSIRPVEVPAPPLNVVLSPVPNLTAAQAVEWCRSELELCITARYLKSATDSGQLRCQIVAGRRMYSTRELFRFIVTRPPHTAAKRKATA